MVHFHLLGLDDTHAGRERFKNKAKWWFINGELSAADRDCRYERYCTHVKKNVPPFFFCFLS